MQEAYKNSNSNLFDPNFNLALEKCKAEWKIPKHYKIMSILGFLICKIIKVNH